MKCPSCGGRLKTIRGQSSEPEGIRNDAWCEKERQRYMVTKAYAVAIDGDEKKTTGEQVFPRGSGLSKGQALRRLDASTQKLRQDVMQYWELAGLEEADADRIIKATASLNRAITAAHYPRTADVGREPGRGLGHSRQAP